MYFVGILIKYVVSPSFTFSSTNVFNSVSGPYSAMLTYLVQNFATPWIVAYQPALSMGILQGRILEWVALPSYKGSSRPYAAAAAKSLQSCPTLCDPIDGSPPGSPVPGILQARTLEWAAISFSNA